MIKKGFTLVQMLLSLLLLSSITLITLHNANVVDVKHFYYLNDYLYTQSKSLLNKSSNAFKDDIRFNSMGRVNKAKTIKIGKHNIIIHLGTGYITYD